MPLAKIDDFLFLQFGVYFDGEDEYEAVYLSLSQDTLNVLMLIGRQGPISRAGIARQLNFTASRITRLTEALIAVRLVHETGFEKSTGGRRGCLLALSEDTHLLCGVRISISSTIEVVLTDLHANILAQEVFQADSSALPEQITAQIHVALKQCLAKGENFSQRLIAVGLGVSGLVNPAEGKMLRSRSFPHWKNVPLAPMLADALGLPVFLENEITMTTSAELWFGNGRGCQNFLFVGLGAGVRMGMVIDGRLYRGSTGNAGELGHTTFRKKGPICHCGNSGCVECYVSTNRLLAWGREALQSYSDSLLADFCNRKADALTLGHIIQAAERGDRLALTLFRRVCQPAGQSIAALINIFDTQKILVGGGLAAAGRLLLDLLEEEIAVHAFPLLRSTTTLEIAHFLEHGAVIGGGALILEKICSGDLKISGARSAELTAFQ